MTIWKKLSQLHTDKFNASGDILHALKALAADARIPERPKFKLNNVTVEDFLSAISETSKSGGDIDDGLQKILNKQVSLFLLQHLTNVRADLPVLRSPLPRNHLTGLIPEVLPFDKDSLISLKESLLAAPYQTPEIIETIKEIANSSESLQNALSFALGMAFISVIKQQIINNPILTILPSDMVKTAAGKPKLNSRSPRLNDLIEALRIVHGMHLIKYNQSVLADFMQAPVPTKEGMNQDSIFPHGPPDKYREHLKNTPAQLAIIAPIYMSYYKELQRTISEYCWANITDVNTKVISDNGEVLTPNIYLRSDVSDLSGVNSVAELNSREQKLASLDLNMTMWNGQKYKVSSTNLSVAEMRSKILDNRKYEDVAAEILDDSMESMDRARNYIKNQSLGKKVVVLSNLMLQSNEPMARTIFNELLVTAKDAADKVIKSNDGYLYTSASEEATKSYGTVESNAEIAGTAFNTKDLNKINDFNKEIALALATARASVLEKYGRLFKDRLSLDMIFVDMFKTYAMPLLPITMRYIYNSTSVANIVQGSPGPKGGKYNIDSIIKDVFPHLSEVLKSQQFSDRYDANESEYKSSVVNLDAISVLRDESLGGTAVDSKLEPLMHHLGIDKAGLKAKQVDLAMAYGGSSPDAKRKRRAAINKTISDIMVKYDELDKQGLTTGITREHVIVYICNKVLPGVIEDHVVESLNNKVSAKTTEQQEQVSNFVRTNFMSLKGGRSGALLASNTVYGKLSQLYRAIAEGHAAGLSEEDLVKLKSNPLAAIEVGADYGYRSARAAPSLAVISRLFEKNRADTSVSDESWSDPTNPRPRSWKELAQLTGAFADPIPDTTSGPKSIVRKKRLNIQPGERYSVEQVNSMNAELKKKSRGSVVAGTVQSTIQNTVRRLGENVFGNPVAAVRMALMERRKEILSVSNMYKDDIIPYTIEGKIPFDKSPFVTNEAIKPIIEVDFSEVKLDTESSKKIMDDADEHPKIKSVMDDLSKGGLAPETLKKVELELRKLPISYLSDKNITTTVDMVLGKVAPGTKPTIRRESPRKPDQGATSSKYESARDAILSLSKTIFVKDQLADRLIPTAHDTVQKLNGKAEELMQHLQILFRAQADLGAEIPKASHDPKLQSELRHLLSISKVYNSHLLRALNKAKLLSERTRSEDKGSEFDYIRDTLPESRKKIHEFISRMSEMPFYKGRPDIVEILNLVPDSLTRVSDMDDAISPQSLQILLLDLKRRSAANDGFNNLLSELDQYRVRNTRPQVTPDKAEDVQDIERIFTEQAELGESAIKQELARSLTSMPKPGE